ncbi:aminotransferase class V-fold PLP-dependent enzyme [Maricaulis sp. D1M11]|uniref:aminotransferase class V-fold PLP-dependent enzyme n=1 Tax=Maricaulis sp. D1M11 TaxID=3076117 RepID=UPI0039B556EB
MKGNVMGASVEEVQAGLVGRGDVLRTPFGIKPLIYADYTASGRNFTPIDEALDTLARLYANPHTEDSWTGRVSGSWMRDAKARIKQHLGASPEHIVMTCGAGATSAIHKLQEVLGLALPPATRDRLDDVTCEARPVVFIGPYEHHSNELSWRESLADVVRVPLDASGRLDMAAMAEHLADPIYEGRRKIVAVSAASNVTGVRTDIAAIARLAHRNGAVILLDCAASAPYQKIEMCPLDDAEASIDAVYFSPHKFIGGPGACGVLVMAPHLYRSDLPPTQAAGGTVVWVSRESHDFIESAEAREMSGTPGVPQLVRAALALQLQADIGHEVIEQREHAAVARAFESWSENDRIEILGPLEPAARIGIVSFTLLKSSGERLHPRLVTVLLNDVFGIQSRAGCSCAGPYGHDLLDLDDTMSRELRARVLGGEAGARPGWCRVSLHWVMSEAEISYLVQAVNMLADHADALEALYDYTPQTGRWVCRLAEAMDEALPGLPTHVLGEQAARADDPICRCRPEQARSLEQRLNTAFSEAAGLVQGLENPERTPA